MAHYKCINHRVLCTAFVSLTCMSDDGRLCLNYDVGIIATNGMQLTVIRRGIDVLISVMGVNWN